MNTHKLFQEFDGNIKISDSKKEKLRKNRDALRDKIIEYFKEKRWSVPEFRPQGSFPLGTNLNPIKEKAADGTIKERYDLDDGIYFICPEQDRKTPDAYHGRIASAVHGHTDTTKDKDTCVRVVYKDGHHIDLPIYWVKSKDGIPEIAHKSLGYMTSDPEKFSDWVKNNTSNNKSGQLKRIIRYLKAWVNYRQHSNSSLRLPSGIIFTILACNHYSENDKDDVALKNTLEAIHRALTSNFSCYRPTVPKDENLLSRKKYDKGAILSELDKFVKSAINAVSSDCEKESSEYWRKCFGDRFPLGEKGGNGGRKIAPAVVLPVVSATKPYASDKNDSIFNLKCDDEDLAVVKKFFPDLRYNPSDKCIEGQISFRAVYKPKKHKSHEEWKVFPCLEGDKDCVSGNYEIKITLDTRTPKVFETSGKILRVREKLNKTPEDMHLFSQDMSCCLGLAGVGFNPDLRLSDFIIHGVYPYFVWQAYYEKYEKLPPCGEYSHGNKGVSEYLRDAENWGRNRPCYCGSGKKFKKCCLLRH